MNDRAANDALLARVVPPLAGVVLVAAFVSLGLWQLDRAAQKEALAAMFADDAPYRSLRDIDEPVPFQRVEANGRLLGERQILIDNIVRNGRLGYFVITALDQRSGAPLLLVNRGWLSRDDDASVARRTAVGDDRRTLRGRIGRLPRVGIRSGDAFEGSDDWPRIAVYPTADEVARQLGREVLPFILLLDPDAADGFERSWAPTQSGPMIHYGYAFQWFAMALAVLAIGAWQIRKRWRAR